MVEGSVWKGRIEGFWNLNVHDVIEIEMFEICFPLGSKAPYRWLTHPGKCLSVLVVWISLIFIIFCCIAVLQGDSFFANALAKCRAMREARVGPFKMRVEERNKVVDAIVEVGNSVVEDIPRSGHADQ